MASRQCCAHSLLPGLHPHSRGIWISHVAISRDWPGTQQVKLPAAMPAFHMGTSLCSEYFQSASLLTAGQAAEADLHSPALAVTAICIKNQ